ncbi:Pycsar system effector family protein [Gillisia hiemivivida]|uniref:Pycsar effector protein domain-containing protein n=1 Tax=Gillisia hiemivivida TaxID=291190 RepID=A0A5C6ZW74_9FLAO|nr:Pycsar system effector family protein [Gillisia hiemivivida]TXD95193.1 hypothetical protein ES724_03305 [Gillisia hiemivivida]
MNKELLQIFSNINDWLRFAEAKNAMIIAFNGASIYGIVKLPFLNNFTEMGFLQIYSIGIILMLIISSTIALLSFVPNLHFLKGSTYLELKDVNLLFYQHLKQLESKKLKKLLCEKAGVKESDFTKLDDDLISQIKYNATIASRKYHHFSVAVWLTIACYASIPIALIFALYHYKN